MGLDIKRILIIDDEKLLTEITQRILEKYGYYVYIINDPRLVKEQFIYNFFDIVILDMRMPYLSGFDILKIIKDIDQTQKIIMCSGWFEGDPPVGCIASLRKPYKTEELLTLLKENLKND